MTLPILVPWLLTIVLASVGLGGSLFQRRELKVTRIYLGYCAVAGSTQLAFRLLWPGSYYSAYWCFEVAHNILLYLLGIEIICCLLPRRRAVPWICVASALPLIVLLAKLPTRPTTALVSVSTSAAYAAGMLLMALFFMSPAWTRERAIATGAVASILVGDLLSSFGLSYYSGPLKIATVQLAPLIGLILLSVAADPNPKGTPADLDAEEPGQLPKSKPARGHAA